MTLQLTQAPQPEEQEEQGQPNSRKIRMEFTTHHNNGSLRIPGVCHKVIDVHTILVARGPFEYKCFPHNIPGVSTFEQVMGPVTIDPIKRRAGKFENNLWEDSIDLSSTKLLL